MAPTADKRLTAAIAGAGLAEDAKPARSFSMAVFHFALAGLLIITISGHAAAEGPARASVDPRTGAIVVSGGELERSNVPRGAPVVRVIEEPVVSQPPPFSSGKTVVVPRTRIEIEGGTTGGSAGRTIRIVEEPVVSHLPPFSKGGQPSSFPARGSSSRMDKAGRGPRFVRAKAPKAWSKNSIKWGSAGTN